MDAIFPSGRKGHTPPGPRWDVDHHLVRMTGETGARWSKANFRGVPGGGCGDLTQDSFVDGNTIYATSRLADWRDNRPGKLLSGEWFYPGKTLPALLKSTDNGRTWDFVSLL